MHWNLELGKNGFVGSVFCPTNPEHFPPAPHLKRVDALAVGFLEGPSLCAVEKNATQTRSVWDIALFAILIRLLRSFSEDPLLAMTEPR